MNSWKTNRDSINKVDITFEALPENQSMARAFVSAYLLHIDPTIEELTEIKTAVSEAVSNAIIHGYENQGKGKIFMEISQPCKDKIFIKIMDKGKGIVDVKKAMEPLFTTSVTPELSGMGFTVMESFTDNINVESTPGAGTCVTMTKILDSYYGR